jgi:hypothetical protein
VASQNGTSGNGIRQYTQPQQAMTSDSQIAQMLLKKAVTETQQIYNGTLYPVAQANVNIPPQAVGILTRFWVVATCTLTNTSGTETAHLTNNGIANIFQNVRFYDTNNLLRHDTTSLHLTHVAAAKRRHPFAASATWNGTSGNNQANLFSTAPASWGVLQAPATIAPGATATIRALFEVPIACSAQDLRGAIFVNTVNSTMNLYLEFNQNAFVDTGTTPTLDDTFAIYNGAPGTFTSCQLQVYQEFLDQLPMSKGAYILPNKALSIAYMLNRSTLSALVQGQDFPIPYINFRSYLSSFLIYNNSGSAGGCTYGTDVNYLEELAANFAPYFKYDPLFAAYKWREVFQNDAPAGTYYISHRFNPVYTTQAGNRQIIINPKTVNAGAYVYWMSEFFANQNVLQGAGSAS